MKAENRDPQVSPEQIVQDYLIGEYELEKLKNGFQAPVIEGPCAEHRSLASEQHEA